MWNYCPFVATLKHSPDMSSQPSILLLLQIRVVGSHSEQHSANLLFFPDVELNGTIRICRRHMKIATYCGRQARLESQSPRFKIPPRAFERSHGRSFCCHCTCLQPDTAGAACIRSESELNRIRITTKWSDADSSLRLDLGTVLTKLRSCHERSHGWDTSAPFVLPGLVRLSERVRVEMRVL